MNNQTIDLNTIIDESQLKALAYDRMAIISNAQTELNAIQKRLEDLGKSEAKKPNDGFVGQSGEKPTA